METQIIFKKKTKNSMNGNHLEIEMEPLNQGPAIDGNHAVPNPGDGGPDFYAQIANSNNHLNKTIYFVFGVLCFLFLIMLLA